MARERYHCRSLPWPCRPWSVASRTARWNCSDATSSSVLPSLRPVPAPPLVRPLTLAYPLSNSTCGYDCFLYGDVVLEQLLRPTLFSNVEGMAVNATPVVNFLSILVIMPFLHLIIL